MSIHKNTSFKDKVVWVTGAGSGIGRDVAQMFASEGATLVLMGRRLKPLEEVYDEVVLKGGKGEVVSLDVSDREAVNTTAERLLQQWGRVDILVNNAGLNIQQRRMHALKPEDWDLVINVNLTGAYNMVAAVLPPMRKQGGGLIVNISSMAAKAGSGLSGPAYTAAKHGMNGLSHSINIDEWSHGIRSTALCPGEVNTDILDKRPVPVDPEDREKMIHPEDIAHAVRFLASLHPRTTITEMLVLPTNKRQFKPGET